MNKDPSARAVEDYRFSGFDLSKNPFPVNSEDANQYDRAMTQAFRLNPEFERKHELRRQAILREEAELAAQKAVDEKKELDRKKAAYLKASKGD